MKDNIKCVKSMLNNDHSAINKEIKRIQTIFDNQDIKTGEISVHSLQLLQNTLLYQTNLIVNYFNHEKQRMMQIVDYIEDTFDQETECHSYSEDTQMERQSNENMYDEESSDMQPNSSFFDLEEEEKQQE